MDIIEKLKRLSVETGSLACLGCGREHNCSVHGCAILREAISEIEKLRDPTHQPVTNADRIRAMSDEELATVLMCPLDESDELIIAEDGSCGRSESCTSCVLDWLRQPAEADD